MGVPTRPHRSLEDLFVFLAGSETFTDLAESFSFETASDINKRVKIHRYPNRIQRCYTIINNN